jgi:hypothetical protein
VLGSCSNFQLASVAGRPHRLGLHWPGARIGKPVELHGLIRFGWETDTPGFDGLWVSCADSCGRRGEAKGREGACVLGKCPNI